jgi:hypothetical protein
MCKNTNKVTKCSGLLEYDAVSVSGSRLFEETLCPHIQGQAICLTRQLKEPQSFETPGTAYRHGVIPQKVDIFSSKAVSSVQMSFHTALRSVRHCGVWCCIVRFSVLAMTCYFAAAEESDLSMWYLLPFAIRHRWWNWTKNLRFEYERFDNSCLHDLQSRNEFMIRSGGWQCTWPWSLHP